VIFHLPVTLVFMSFCFQELLHFDVPPPQALFTQVSSAPYLSSQVVCMAPVMPGTFLVLEIHSLIAEPSSSPS
jgi:hypothetical protein